MPAARVVRLPGQGQERLTLLVVVDPVEGQQVGDVTLLEADPAEFHAAGFGPRRADLPAGVVAAQALALPQPAQLRTEQDAKHGGAAAWRLILLTRGHRSYLR